MTSRSQCPRLMLILAVLGALVASVNAQDSAVAIDEETRAWLETVSLQAESSCVSHDQSGLIDAMLQSPAVLAAYSASTINVLTLDRSGTAVRTESIEASNYAGQPSLFPLAMLDYSRVANPAVTGSVEPVDVVLEYREEPGGGFAVQWSMVQFGGEEMDTPFHTDGTPYEPFVRPDGELVFEATSNCWALVADRRWQ